MKLRLNLLLGMATLFVMVPALTHAQPVHKGNVIIDAYYGVPNLMTGFFRLIAREATDDPNLKVTSLGPFGGKAQYMVTDNIGLGLDFYYARSGFKYTDQNVDTLGNVQTYTYELNNPRPRILVRMDYHFGASEIVDPYVAVGLGYSAARYTFKTDDPLFEIAEYADLRSLIPVAYRLAFGTKFYFAKFMGAGAEVAIGGPLLTFGLSAKF